ncbi:MAG: hypothetical protein OR994_06305 [Candidatus Poseidoniales archaeon]|jgi:hypothetical protein|nr:hypothetical protein [Candidatus Poseidoniales archaeon]|tara:strand:+ start:5384 stop:5632 length:249 start_codon:yes stop_codon:yes gene_type:complete
MSSQKKGFPDLVDNAIDNPAYELFGGYHIFLRRLFIPMIIALVGIFAYDITSNKILSAIIAGLSVGPIFNLERYMAERKQHK